MKEGTGVLPQMELEFALGLVERCTSPCGFLAANLEEQAGRVRCDQ